MKGVSKFAVLGLGLLAISGTPGQAATPIAITPGTPQTLTPGATYQYGATSFSITGCGSCSGYEIEGIFNGRGGTEIEILKSSYIFTGTTHNNSNQNVTLAITVAPLAGNQGINTVTNILEGSDVVTSTGASVTTYNSSVTSALSKFTNSAGAAATSDLTNTSSSATFSNVTSGSFTFDDKLSLVTTNSQNRGYTLALTDVKLLLNPAPEPASMALLATGLAGLIAARRRYSHRQKR